MYKVSFYIKLNCLVLCPYWLWQMTINGLLCFRKLENANQCSYFNTYIQLFSQLYEYQLDHLEKLDFSLSFCSTIVFIQLSSSISQVHLHRHVQNTVTSHCGTANCNVYFVTVFFSQIIANINDSLVYHNFLLCTEFFSFSK